jgi:hypothetical protein
MSGTFTSFHSSLEVKMEKGGAQMTTGRGLRGGGL